MITASEETLEKVRALLALNGLPADAATEVTLASILTAAEAMQASLDILDNAVSGNEMQVDIIIHPNIGIDSVAVPAVLRNNRMVVAAPATDEVLGGDVSLAIGVTIKAESDNTGKIYVGAEGVTSATGYQLSPGEQVFIPISNLNLVWLDTEQAGDGVTYIGN